MILTIKSATLEAGDYGDYMKVTGVDGNGKEVAKNIGEKFKDKWDLLQENATVNIKMVQRDRKWYVDDVEPIKIEVDETKITEQQAAVAAKVEPGIVGARPRVISGEERGMWWKELGNRIGDGSLDKNYPKNAVRIKAAYYKKMSEITGIDFRFCDGEFNIK